VFSACNEAVRLSKLRLRRAIVSAATFGLAIELGEPGGMEMPQITGRATLDARCPIPFTGNHQLFELSTPAGSGLRKVRGEAEGNVLMLNAEGGSEDVKWLPSLFTAEIMVIEQHLAAQADVITCYHAELEGRVRSLVERVYPVLDPRYLRDIDEEFAAFPERPELRRTAWEQLLSLSAGTAAGAEEALRAEKLREPTPLPK